MSSISSLGKMVSGLKAGQRGLQVTGQNLTNINTKGYTRQQLLQHETGYLNVGSSGGRNLQVGLGVTCTEIRQIRDGLADVRLRQENSVLSYYQNLKAASNEIEAIFDEPYGDTVSDLLNEFWAQTEKLKTSPSGVDERISFIKSAHVLAGKLNEISNSLSGYQEQANKQVEKSVARINQIIKDIQTWNEKIAQAEINGDNANDYRDQRNLLLDELSTYGEVKYYEEADNRLLVKFEGHIVVNKKFTNTLELKQTVEESPFNKPIWSDTKEDAIKMDREITNANGNDTGGLKALLLIRGDNYVTSDTTWDDIALNNNFSVDKQGNSYMIPKYHKMLNDFTNELVVMVNNGLNGMGTENKVGERVFVPIEIPASLKSPAPNATPEEILKYNEAYNALLVPGNIQVNPKLLEEGGYNYLGTLDPNGEANDVGNNNKVIELLNEWKKNRDWYKDDIKSSPLSKCVDIKTFFSELVTDIGTDGAEYGAKSTEKNISVANIENERQSMGGVSQDEEFANMLKYQYAYNASARVITLLDSMIDTIINRM